MSLLGWPLLALLGLSAVAYPVLTLLLWPRVRGSGPLRAATRLVMVAGCQVTAVLLVAVAVNDYGYFYGSWSELPGLATPGPAASGPQLGPVAGAAPAAVAATARPPVAGPPPSARLHVLPDPGWSSRQQWATRGRVDSVTIHGVRSGLTSHAFVYLPPQYFQAELAHRAL